MFVKLINTIADPKNKETYKTMQEAFGSVQEAQDSGALDKIKNFAGGLVGIADLLSPVTDLLEPFSTLGDIFSSEVEGSLSNILSDLFTSVLSDTNLALISSLATKIGGLFEKVFTEDNIRLIGTFVEALITLITLVVDSTTELQSVFSSLEAYSEAVAEGQAGDPWGFGTYW